MLSPTPSLDPKEAKVNGQPPPQGGYDPRYGQAPPNAAIRPQPGQQVTAPPGSVLDALVTVEEHVLARYCRGFSIDGVIAQTVTIDLSAGQTLWA